MATVVVPLAAPAKMEDDLMQMMAGALSMLRPAGCALVGGHSSEGAEMALGERGAGWLATVPLQFAGWRLAYKPH